MAIKKWKPPYRKSAIGMTKRVALKVGVGWKHSSIIVPLDTFKPPNVSFWYVFEVIIDVPWTPEKALDETISDVSL